MRTMTHFKTHFVSLLSGGPSLSSLILFHFSKSSKSSSWGDDRWGGGSASQEVGGSHQTGRALCRPPETERGILRRGEEIISEMLKHHQCCNYLHCSHNISVSQSKSFISWGAIRHLYDCFNGGHRHWSKYNTGNDCCLSFHCFLLKCKKKIEKIFFLTNKRVFHHLLFMLRVPPVPERKLV